MPEIETHEHMRPVEHHGTGRAGTCDELLTVTEKLSIAIANLQARVKNRYALELRVQCYILEPSNLVLADTISSACVPGMWEDSETGVCGCELLSPAICKSLRL